MRRVEEAIEGELAGGAAARADGGQTLAGGGGRGLAHRRAVNLARLDINTKYLFNHFTYSFFILKYFELYQSNDFLHIFYLHSHSPQLRMMKS